MIRVRSRPQGARGTAAAPSSIPVRMTLLALMLALVPTARPAAAQQSDSAAALAAFRANIAAIHARDRARYLSSYLQSPRMVRTGPAGIAKGYDSFAAGQDDSWPDTLVATHFGVTPLAPGVVHGAYHYRVVQNGVSSRGVSERVLVETDAGWKIAVTGAYAAPPALPPPAFALVGATLVDGTGAPPITDAVVVMRDGVIECAGRRAECPLADDVEPVDAAGAWITPGLVDAHVHYSQTGWADGRPDAYDARDRFPYAETIADLEANPDRIFQANLCSGVTATFDVGGYPWTWRLGERTELDTRSPHVAAAGPLLSTRDHWLNVPAARQFIHMADEAATREGARYLLANDTDAVKVWFLAGPRSADTTAVKTMVNAAGEEARNAGKPLIVHATGLWQAKVAVRAGAHLLVHSVENEAVDDEFLRLARETGTIYTPTLVVADGYRQLRAGDFDADAYELACVDPVSRAKAFLTDSLTVDADRPGLAEMRESAAERERRLAENLRRVHAAGVPVAMGTDAGNPLTLHGPSVYLEMEAMQAAGLSPLDVLVAATRNGALAMRRLDDFGTIEPGKTADLVVLDADPTADIRNMRRVRLVVRRGEIWTRDELEFDDVTATRTEQP